MPLFWMRHPHLAHGIERPTQLIAAHRGQILALEINLGAIARRQMVVALQGRGIEQVAQGCRGEAGILGKITHTAD